LGDAEKIQADYNPLAWGWTSFVINAEAICTIQRSGCEQGRQGALRRANREHEAKRQEQHGDKERGRESRPESSVETNQASFKLA
jgi:hypothetical protein